MASTPRKPTAEQHAVIGSCAPRLVVTAAAGAGKTFTLVERYLRHVQEDGFHPDQILTITFTKKAAAEMKGRIVEKLLSAGLDEEAQSAETGPIQTIHGFCERLLRENSVEAGMDPAFEILPEGEASRWTDEAIRESLTADHHDEPSVERLIRTLAGKRVYRGTDPYGSVREAIRSVLSPLRGAGHDRHQLREWYARPDCVLRHWEDTVMQHLEPDVREALRRTMPGEPFVTRLKTAYQLLGLRVPPIFALAPNELMDAECAAQTAGLVQLACEVWARLESRMRREQRLDFTALESTAVSLLEQRPTVRQRLCTQYRAMMVDEAQDVNPMQHRLLANLDVEVAMLVGDVQQSIYGFRQADPDGFTAQATKGEHLRLTKNHRSAAGIQHFVDRVFGSLFGEGYAPMTPAPNPADLNVVEAPVFPGVELWEQKAKSVQDVAAYLVEMLDEGEVKPKDVTVLVRTGPYGVDLQAALRAHGREARIIGESDRFYARLEIRDLANALRAVADPYDDFALLSTLRSPFGGLSIDAVFRLAAQRPVGESLAAAKLPNAEDQAKLERFLAWYLPLRGIADRLAAWEVIAELFAQTGYLEALARRRDGIPQVANVRKLLSLATQSPELGPLEYAELIREIRELRHKEGDAPTEEGDVVTIMNIHKAKGLEFPVVVLPQTFDTLFKRSGDLEVDPRLPMVVAAYRKGPKPVFHAWLAKRRQDREQQEELRVLYVGMTRAEKRLCLVTGGGITRNCAARILGDRLGWKASPPHGFEKIRLMRDSTDL